MLYLSNQCSEDERGELPHLDQGALYTFRWRGHAQQLHVLNNISACIYGCCTRLVMRCRVVEGTYVSRPYEKEIQHEKKRYGPELRAEGVPQVPPAGGQR